MLLNSNRCDLGNVRFVIRRIVIVGLPCKACVLFSINPLIPVFTHDCYPLFATDGSAHILFKSIKKRLVLMLHISCSRSASTMDQIDAFPEHISTAVVPVTLPEKPDALEYAARQGQVCACIIYQEPSTKSVFVLFCKDNWPPKNTPVDNFKRAILEAKQANEFRNDDVL
ncbi:uncharacterized protein TNCV_3327501 [Trichonephila clavipes]|nr:uncharacterized protein TNCV_3327501 [Trichonephila clavipes]